MSWFRGTRGIRAIGVFALMVAVLAGCGTDRAETCTEMSSLQVAGEEAPSWADRWVHQGGGAMGGGRISVAEGDNEFAGVYSCVGLKDSPWIELTDDRGAPVEHEVRVGVLDYLYRAGEAIVDGERYSVDIAVAHTDSVSRDFGVAFAPATRTRTTVDAYAGAYVIQMMREDDVL